MYLGFRLAPFIIVFYFVFQSFLNFEIRGVVYLAGLIGCTFAIYMSNGLLGSMFPPESFEDVTSSKCNVISLGENGNILWPPGPDERTNCSASSSSWIESVGVIRSMAQL